MLFMGIDVQIRRPCAFAVVDSAGVVVDSGWFEDPGDFALKVKVRWGRESLSIGVDACRFFLRKPRAWYWNGKVRRWREKKAGERGWGRHCEVVIKALGWETPSGRLLSPRRRSGW